MANAFANPGLAQDKLPPVNASDNGKVLTVASGEWAAGDAPSGLPDVTAEDNGKILTVADGEWVAGIAGKSGVLIMEETDPPQLNKTLNEINSMIGDGILPFLKVADGGGGDEALVPVSVINMTSLYVIFPFGEEPILFAASSADEKPVMQQGG